ncbi:hypothetical protein EGR_08384 [Echinococcus granulosus]|uniref:Uncharacterized protein n=1 Tax=Echinococcus granulosus TaxID=6210 RepID=W6U8K0_ECHGR|nr:hypothetical protein EGR_08384 [Echinococcus granulosus]EUB56741.1 hypothetical protein EGR_08384 [Echinococcus granulosus]
MEQMCAYVRVQQTNPFLLQTRAPLAYWLLGPPCSGLVGFGYAHSRVASFDQSRGLLRTLIHCPGKLSLTLPMPSSCARLAEHHVHAGDTCFPIALPCLLSPALVRKRVMPITHPHTHTPLRQMVCGPCADGSPNLSPMSRQARALHIIRASSQPGRLRFADIAHLDQTITTMRRLVPPVSSTTVPEKINTVEDLETLLIDTIHLFKRLIEDPEIVTALRARLASKTTAASNEVPVTAPHLSVPSVQTEVDNLFTLLKLKRRSKKRIIPMRI